MFSDPLQSEEMALAYDSSHHSDSEDERMQQQVSNSHSEKRRAVLHWPSDQVKLWVQENVPFSHHRMQECLHAFEAGAIDGLGLLTLRKSHRACLGMNDFEWLLFKAARRRLLSGTEKTENFSSEQADWRTNLTAFVTPPCTPTKDDSRMASPRSPFSLRSNSSIESTSSRVGAAMSTPRSLFGFPKLSWSSDITKDEQMELLITEVQCLRGEVVRAEERQTTLQAQMHHIDSVLRTALLTGYLYTRTRWIALLGEPLIDDADMDDWIQRFLVFEGSSIFFYLCATEMRPQGTILLDDIVAAGPLLTTGTQYQDGRRPLFSFYITTCHGLRLECCTPSKLQADSWLTLLGVDMEMGGVSRSARNVL